MKRLFSKRKSSVSGTAGNSLLTQLPAAKIPFLQSKLVIPPLPHPHPHSLILVLVTSDGLLLRPSVEGLAHTTTQVKISWGKDAIVEEIPEMSVDWTLSATVYGIVGILRLFNASYLLVITARSHVGDLFHETRAVFRVDGVSAIPLEADRATMAVNIIASQGTTESHMPSSTINGAGDVDEANTEAPENEHGKPDASSSTRVKFVEQEVKSFRTLGSHEQEIPNPPSPISSGASTPNSASTALPLAKVLATRLSFWNHIPKRVAAAERSSDSDDRSPSPAILERGFKDGEDAAEVLDSILASAAPSPSTTEERNSELDEKIIRETIKEFVKGGMYFSYHIDITTSLQRKQQRVAKMKRHSSLLSDLQALDEQSSAPLSSVDTDAFEEPQQTLPLWRRVDRRYWWNESLSRPFIDAGLHSYVLPIMQGYYQIASFHVSSSGSNIPPTGQPSHADDGGFLEGSEGGHLVDYVLISRRSRDRAGRRYQRRGIDDDANVANFVETEAIMRIEREGRSNVFSFIQIRGSIPLFWTQPGYGLKPAPQLSTERTNEQTMDALARHFQRTIVMYGPIVIVNLAEQHGKEGNITAAYRERVEELDLGGTRYHEYDFHAETKGMRYENISRLISELERSFESHGFFWVSGGVVMSEQKGAFRVNCIDCLDRTNVVQSAFARYVLHSQLEAVAVLNANEAGDRTEADVVFNDVWANNGDAISREYAGTSALKGDFTRTGKRDIGGLFNDGLNSLSRVYSSTFSDWFSQAVIDFMLGNRTLSVFSEFLLKLSSTDPRELIRISKIRAAAIETSASRVLSEGERQIAGWTLLSPVDLNTRLGDKFEEKVLLLTAKALYMVSFDYSLDKVKLFTRIPLGDIIGITKGIYILSPLEEASRDPADNYGFVISYHPSRIMTRVTSYSLRNTVATTPSTPSGTATRISRMLTMPTRQLTALSRILSDAVAPGTVVSAAFKALPVDHAANVPTDLEDTVAAAPTCRDAVDAMVEMVRQACADIGSGTRSDFVCEKDIVSLAEAQRMTTMFAKLEYNFKRLLWLGS